MSIHSSRHIFVRLVIIVQSQYFVLTFGVSYTRVLSGSELAPGQRGGSRKSRRVRTDLAAVASPAQNEHHAARLHVCEPKTNDREGPSIGALVVFVSRIHMCI